MHDDLNEALYKIASSELRERALQEQLNQLSDSHEYLAEENKDYKKTLMVRKLAYLLWYLGYQREQHGVGMPVGRAEKQ